MPIYFFVKHVKYFHALHVYLPTYLPITPMPTYHLYIYLTPISYHQTIEFATKKPLQNSKCSIFVNTAFEQLVTNGI